YREHVPIAALVEDDRAVAGAEPTELFAFLRRAVRLLVHFDLDGLGRHGLRDRRLGRRRWNVDQADDVVAEKNVLGRIRRLAKGGIRHNGRDEVTERASVLAGI